MARKLCAAVVFVVGFGAGSRPLAQLYSVTDLGALGGSGTSFARGISNNGIVVGDSNSKAFKWTQGGGMVELNGLGGTLTIAYGVNGAGRAVGYSSTGTENHAVLWDGGTSPTDLGTAGQFSEAKAINESSTITGTANLRAFRKTYGGSMDTLPTLDGITVGSAINRNDVVAGGSDDISDVRHAYRYSSGPTLEDLGVQAGADYSTATGINDTKVVGYSAFNTTFGAWVNSGGGFTPLNGLFTYENRAWGISNVGHIVGWSWTSSSGDDSKAVLWLDGTTDAIDLNTRIPGFESEWVLKSAYAINDTGWIVGSGLQNGVSRGFLLTQVPEPGALFAMAMGLAVCLKRRRRSAL